MATVSLSQVARRLGLTPSGARYAIDRAGLGERVGGRRVISDVDLAALELARRTGGSINTCRLFVLRQRADDLGRRAHEVAQ